MNVAPISINAVTNLIKYIIGKSINSVIHLSGNNDITYKEIGKLIINELGAKSKKLKPIMKYKRKIVRKVS